MQDIAEKFEVGALSVRVTPLQRLRAMPTYTG
jgi:hypothetical protein